MVMLDSVDEQLIKLLGQNARQSSETLAKRLKISSATVRRRLKKLVQSNSLRIVGLVDPKKLGLDLAVVITLNVHHSKIESIMEELAKLSEIRWILVTTGRFDIIVLARFRSTNHLYDFMSKNIAQLEGLKNSETFICLKGKKRGPYLTLT